MPQRRMIGRRVHVSPEPKPQPSTLTLDECLKLISMNKDSPFELDTFVHVPLEPREPEEGWCSWMGKPTTRYASKSIRISVEVSPNVTADPRHLLTILQPEEESPRRGVNCRHILLRTA